MMQVGHGPRQQGSRKWGDGNIQEFSPQLAGMATGNPLLDMYSQYAAQAQAQAYSQQVRDSSSMQR